MNAKKRAALAQLVAVANEEVLAIEGDRANDRNFARLVAAVKELITVAAALIGDKGDET